MSKGPTALERAFAIFQRMGGNLLASGDLAELMQVPPTCAVKYVQRLRACGRIEVKGRAGGRDLYGLVAGAEPPPGDRRGYWRKLLESMGDEIIAGGGPKT